jgi:hypothetical protein
LAPPSASAVRRDVLVEPAADNHPSAVGAAYSAPDGAGLNSSTSRYKDTAP